MNSALIYQPFFVSFFSIATAFSLLLGEGIAWSMLVLWLLSQIIGKTSFDDVFFKYLPCKLLSLCFLGFFLSGVVMWFLGSYGSLRFREIAHLFPWFWCPITLFLLRHRTHKQRHAIAVSFFVGLFVAIVFSWLRMHIDLPSFEHLIRSPESLAASQAFQPQDARQYAAGGFYSHRLKMAHLLLLGLIPLGIRQYLLPLGRSQRLLEGFLLLACLWALAFTFVRADVVALAVSWSLVFYFERRSAWKLLLLFLVLVIGLWNIPEAWLRISSLLHAESNAERVIAWTEAQQILYEHPFGIGLGNYPSIVGSYYDSSYPAFDARTYPHNMVLSAWSETGPLGLLCYVGYFAVLIVTMMRGCLPRRVSLSQFCLKVSGLMMIVAFWILGFGHDIFYHNIVAMAFHGAMAFVLVQQIETSAPLESQVDGVS